MAEQLHPPPSEGHEPPPPQPASETTEIHPNQESHALAIIPIEHSLLSTDPEIEEWETNLRGWLHTVPKRRNVSAEEMESWISSSGIPLPQQLQSLHRLELYQRVLKIHKLIRRPNQVKEGGSLDQSQARFQRTDQWIPVYSWLESLDRNEVVKSKEITEWLDDNPEIKDNLYGRHSRYHLMHYIQKCHMKILKRQGKIPKVVKKVSSLVTPVKFLGDTVIQAPIAASPATPATPLNTIPNGVTPPSMTTPQPKVLNSTVTPLATPLSLPDNISSNLFKSNEVALAKYGEALSKYELLTDLENHLTSLVSRHKQAING
ncbi:hypothetical protein MKW98_022429 [Papaver atlanticum]|uniref:Uncharacterized protein n=1 Tax=Papaver atlanticum TaxID=357466 RepID=A0AAD4RZM6_9MAGN|nr:hypothetical protein MKW98_022429 [Papaver atlanticum]